MIATAISDTSYPVRFGGGVVGSVGLGQSCVTWFGEGLSHLAQTTPKVFVSWRVLGLGSVTDVEASLGRRVVIVRRRWTGATSHGTESVRSHDCHGQVRTSHVRITW